MGVIFIDQNRYACHHSQFLKNDGTPKAAKDIWDIINIAGVPRYAELICVSDDPAEAAVNYFILKLMGYADVKVWTKENLSVNKKRY